jgi:hypothetical protein
VTVTELLDICRARGVELTAAGDRLWLRGPAGAVDDALRGELGAQKAKLIGLLVATCPHCGRPTDEKRRCWHCHDRGCEVCGRPTGSAFLAQCVCCGLTGADQPNRSCPE